MRSIEATSHKLDAYAAAVRPKRDAQLRHALAQAITDDGKVRAEKLDGFIDPGVLPGIGLEYVGETVQSLDFPSIASLSYQELTVTVEGARANDGVILGGPNNQQPNLWPYAYVSSNDTVTVRMHNLGASATDPSARTWRVTVVR